jgi:hypothetical protein
MRNLIYSLLLLIIFACSAPDSMCFDFSVSRAKWISVYLLDSPTAPNTWMTFEKIVNLDKVPSHAIARTGKEPSGGEMLSCLWESVSIVIRPPLMR